MCVFLHKLQFSTTTVGESSMQKLDAELLNNRRLVLDVGIKELWRPRNVEESKEHAQPNCAEARKQTAYRPGMYVYVAMLNHVHHFVRHMLCVVWMYIGYVRTFIVALICHAHSVHTCNTRVCILVVSCTIVSESRLFEAIPKKNGS